MDISNLASRRKPSHGHSHYESNILHDVSLNNLLFIQKPSGMHHTLKTKFTTPLKTTLLVQLMFGKPRYKSQFKSIQAYRHCLGYCTSRPFQTCWNYEEWNRQTLFSLTFVCQQRSWCIILHHKFVISEIPPYLKVQSIPMTSYTYTTHIAAKLFNYKNVLQDLNNGVF